MDQTAPSNETFLWSLGACGNNPDLDCDLQLPNHFNNTKIKSI